MLVDIRWVFDDTGGGVDAHLRGNGLGSAATCYYKMGFVASVFERVGLGTCADDGYSTRQ